AAVFTRPEIATVGISHAQIESGEVPARVEVFPLAGNPRAKMRSLRRGFVKLFCRPASGVVIGGVVVAPTASELILPISVAVRNRLTVGDLAGSFCVYPSMTGTITEAARHLTRRHDLDPRPGSALDVLPAQRPFHRVLPPRAEALALVVRHPWRPAPLLSPQLTQPVGGVPLVDGQPHGERRAERGGLRD